jgi:hypothetical protein
MRCLFQNDGLTCGGYVGLLVQSLGFVAGFGFGVVFGVLGCDNFVLSSRLFAGLGASLVCRVIAGACWSLCLFGGFWGVFGFDLKPTVNRSIVCRDLGLWSHV